MKHITLFALGLACLTFSSTNAQSLPSRPDPIEILDINSTVALFKSDRQANQDAVNAAMSKTYALGCPVDSKFNTSTGTFTQRLPMRVGDLFILVSDDPQFNMATPRGTFTTTKLDAAQGKAISNADATLTLEVRPTGEVKNGKLVFEPVSVTIRDMITAEELYSYKVPEK